MLAAYQKVINSSFQKIVQRTKNYLKLTLPNKTGKPPGLQLLKLLFISSFISRGQEVGVSRGGMPQTSNGEGFSVVSETMNLLLVVSVCPPSALGNERGTQPHQTR